VLRAALHLTASLVPVFSFAVRECVNTHPFLVFSAPGGDSDGLIYTTDISSNLGYSTGSCTGDFGGTSAATPIVAGAIAVILEANPALTSRDVRRIIGLTTQKNDPNQSYLPWFLNGASTP